VGFFVNAQEQESPVVKEYEAIYDSVTDRVLLRREFTGGIILHSRGWGLHFRKGRNINFFRSFQWEVDGVSMKSPKQFRTIYPFSNSAKSYFYGKLNHVFITRTGLGIKKLLNRKPYWGGIELRLVYFGGISLAFAKPVYLYIINYPAGNESRTVTVERYDPELHGYDNIFGRAPFLDGIENTSIHPGIYGKLALNFEFGEYNSSIKAVELGAVIDYHPIPIAIMANNPKQSLFLTFYLEFSMGKRYD
jgi:hypothetical protein